MSKSGKKKRKVQTFKCENGHFFKGLGDSPWDDSFIELVVFLYLRGLSLNATIEVVQAFYETDILSKGQILQFIETVADVLPTLDDIDRLFEPKRSGYLAFDGVWFKYHQQELVLLVCFDPVTFDVIEAIWATQESEKNYHRLIDKVKGKQAVHFIKGIYGDGDNGLLSALKQMLPDIPFQICVVHKELKMGELVPVKLVNRSHKMGEAIKVEIREFQELFRAVLYAKTKEESKKALEVLGEYVESSSQERFKAAYRSLRKNFNLTLTHFDHPDMDRDNNLLECFNGCLRPRLELMRGFKKLENLNRYLKLFLLEFRFRPLKESRFKNRRNLTPLQIGGVYLSPYYNFLTYLRTQLHLKYH